MWRQPHLHVVRKQCLQLRLRQRAGSLAALELATGDDQALQLALAVRYVEELHVNRMLSDKAGKRGG